MNATKRHRTPPNATGISRLTGENRVDLGRSPWLNMKRAAAVLATRRRHFTTHQSVPEEPRLRPVIMNPHDGEGKPLPSVSSAFETISNRDPALWPKRGDGGKSREGWNPLADGPMPEDCDRAWDLWRALRKAEDGHDEAAIERALEEYKRFMGRHEPAPASSRDDEKALWLHRYTQCVREGRADKAKEALEALELLEEPVEPSPAVAAFLAVAYQPGVSKSGWYIRFPYGVNDPESRLLCAGCAPSPPDGAVARRDHIYPLPAWEVEADAVCERCGQGGVA